MAAKQLTFRDAARQKLLEGATALADAVRVTLGPRSKCVLIGRKWGAPVACNDGVTVAREVELKDPEQDLGARMIRQAAERTGDVVGDGTSTSTVLAHAILAEGVRNVAAGASHRPEAGARPRPARGGPSHQVALPPGRNALREGRELQVRVCAECAGQRRSRLHDI